jgi:hypothetical protein
MPTIRVPDRGAKFEIGLYFGDRTMMTVAREAQMTAWRMTRFIGHLAARQGPRGHL